MKVSILCPVHDKPPETVAKVLRGLAHQGADQLVLVNDRVSTALEHANDGEIVLLRTIGASAMFGSGLTEINLEGPPGWRSPCISFNAGLAQVTGDITVINHSDVVQAPGNLAVVRQHFTTHPESVLFAKVLESDPASCQGPGHAGPVLCASDHARALTFLTAIPTRALRDIGGWDEAFQAGVCYEDDDLTARLWKHGLDFFFDDRFSGTHISHDRSYFLPQQVSTNMALMLQKHGTTALYRREIALGHLHAHQQQGLTTWSHMPKPDQFEQAFKSPTRNPA